MPIAVDGGGDGGRLGIEIEIVREIVGDLLARGALAGEFHPRFKREDHLVATGRATFTRRKRRS